ncbi:alpha/beta fold hydrolase [Arthrobacter sp. CAN_C5]|uniref:alpha/beta fold hydrolase n=1 Tax=Arthrobacter sp. CAN_C5 TaxID=2760706 RepID=UPI001AE15E6B|nr:alpha/beta hydrolase [Arthrobacter sp. CAN_C5]MBP2216526.1 pimeloyl-ACP methyl ester carboxylesterase [Arthrobacter sp. CAN_C5]
MVISGWKRMTAAVPLGQDRPRGVGPGRGRLSWVVAGALMAGFLAALLLAAAPFIPATESGVTGGILLGSSLGWALLAVLSVRFTDQPQRWAAAPALFLGLGGLVLAVFGAPLQEALAWVWPPALLVLVVWMIVRIRRQLLNRSARVLLYPVLALLVLASLASGYETVRGALTAGTSPGQGRLIDVGGHRLYLDCTGSGSPTVVIEPGAGLTSSDLALIAPTVASDTRVCVYDRAGRGSSDPATAPQDGAQIAADLHTLLERGDESGPYVIAGHSFGGLYALTFAARYPEEVAGLVLVDSTAPASDPAPDTAEPARPDDTTRRLSALVGAAGRFGIGPLLGVESGDHLRSTVDEYLVAGSSVQQGAALKTFADKPLVVLTAGSGTRPGWTSSQNALATLSTNTLHRTVIGATHGSLLDDDQDAAETARGILDAVTAVRNEEGLQ